MVVIDGSASATFQTPLPVSQGGTGAATALGSGSPMLSPQAGSAPVFGARAWCVFDGTLAGTNAPTAGGNVASVTRNGVGDYTVNFSVAMPSANFSVVSMGVQAAGNNPVTVSKRNDVAYTTTTARLYVAQAATLADVALIQLCVFA